MQDQPAGGAGDAAGQGQQGPAQRLGHHQLPAARVPQLVSTWSPELGC
jgi:hypothetical protein